MTERGIETFQRVLTSKFIHSVVGQTLYERPNAKFCIFIGFKTDDKHYNTIQLCDGEGAEWDSISGKRSALKMLRAILKTAEKIPIMKKVNPK